MCCWHNHSCLVSSQVYYSISGSGLSSVLSCWCCVFHNENCLFKFCAQLLRLVSDPDFLCPSTFLLFVWCQVVVFDCLLRILLSRFTFEKIFKEFWWAFFSLFLLFCPSLLTFKFYIVIQTNWNQEVNKYKYKQQIQRTATVSVTSYLSLSNDSFSNVFCLSLCSKTISTKVRLFCFHTL